MQQQFTIQNWGTYLEKHINEKIERLQETVGTRMEDFERRMENKLEEAVKNLKLELRDSASAAALTMKDTETKLIKLLAESRDDIKDALHQGDMTFQKISGEMASQSKAISEVSTKVSSLDSRVGALEGKVSAMDSKVTSMDFKVTSMDGKVNTLDTSVTVLGARTTMPDGTPVADMLSGKHAALTRKIKGEATTDKIQKETFWTKYILPNVATILLGIGITGAVSMINFVMKQQWAEEQRVENEKRDKESAMMRKVIETLDSMKNKP
jgi:hypothetical protein